MPAVLDIIELVHEQTFLGQQINNVYYFENSDGTTDLATLAAWFETNVVPDIKAFQVAELAHVNLRLRNLFDLGETHEEPLTGTGAGAASGNEFPAFFAYAVRLDHNLGSMRPGFKRYAGGSETAVTDALIDPPTIALLAAVGDNLVNPAAVVNTGYNHVIVGRVCAEPNPTAGAVPSCLRYRLPETQAEAAAAGVAYPVSYEVYSQPTTQNSRKWYT